MTQNDFYTQYPVALHSKEQRLVFDLRDCEFSWEQISLVFLHLTVTPYETDWNIKTVAKKPQTIKSQ